jgi:hypothetical protein
MHATPPSTARSTRRVGAVLQPSLCGNRTIAMDKDKYRIN